MLRGCSGASLLFPRWRACNLEISDFTIQTRTWSSCNRVYIRHFLTYILLFKGPRTLYLNICKQNTLILHATASIAGNFWNFGISLKELIFMCVERSRWIVENLKIKRISIFASRLKRVQSLWTIRWAKCSSEDLNPCMEKARELCMENLASIFLQARISAFTFFLLVPLRRLPSRSILIAPHEMAYLIHENFKSRGASTGLQLVLRPTCTSPPASFSPHITFFSQLHEKRKRILQLRPIERVLLRKLIWLINQLINVGKGFLISW